MSTNLRTVGLDVHVETIAVAVAEPGGEVRPLGIIPNRPEAVAKLVRKLGPREQLRVCYEAGPCGYVLYWQLTKKNRVHPCSACWPPTSANTLANAVRMKPSRCRRGSKVRRKSDQPAGVRTSSTEPTPMRPSLSVAGTTWASSSASDTSAATK